MKTRSRLVVVLLFVFAAPVFAGGLMVENAWIREAPPGATTLAGYLTLKNEKQHSVSMVGAMSRDFESIEVHYSVIKDDKATMVQQHRVRIPSYSTVKFEPNGLHLMLINPRRELVVGDKVKIALTFGNFRKLKVVFLVRKGAAGQQ